MGGQSLIPGDLVCFALDKDLFQPGKSRCRVGVVIDHVSFEDRGRDPFPHFRVYFSSDKLLRCRASDLVLIEKFNEHEIQRAS